MRKHLVVVAVSATALLLAPLAGGVGGVLLSTAYAAPGDEVAVEGAVDTTVPKLAAVSEDDVVAACTSADATEDSCQAVIAAYFAYLEQEQVVGTDLQNAIATLVVALAEADVDGAVQAVVVAAIRDIGTNYATGEQATNIVAIADTIEEGGVVETASLGISP